jgi:hypothetical protein
MAGREVVEADNGLTERQQFRKEVGPDETGYPGNEPDSRRRRQVFSKIWIRRRNQEITWMEGTRLPIQGGRAREHDCSIITAAACGYPRRRDKASSIPVARYREWRIKL